MLKITDFFSEGELLTCEPFDKFKELSDEYWDLFNRYHRNENMGEKEKIRAIRVIVRMVSSIFGLPLLLACDCYVKMLDTADFYEADKATYEAEMANVLKEHLEENKVDERPEIPTSEQIKLEEMKNLLEKAWKKPLNE